jgi:hypothetical protein
MIIKGGYNKMVVDAKIMYGEDGSYCCFSYDFMPGATFIAHIEGTPKKLYRLWRKHRGLFKGRILYCIKDKDYFSGHSRMIEDGLYEYIGNI